ncbi:MAG: inositol monophosphatase [Butyrivibrio sp.]|nr:inositol monophosphatase [Butyrivibrio sp.]
MELVNAEIYERIIALAREAGELIRQADPQEADVDAKEGHANFVTRYDRLVQDRLQSGLAEILPGAGFFGEEGGHDGFPENEYTFIVDPIDGTSNFMRGFRMSAIAIALVQDRQRIFGLVYNPFMNEMFTAVRGEGARLNGRPIHVSPLPLAESLVIFGTAPYYPGQPAVAFAKAQELLPQCIDVRRMGSAELDLCYVACGRAGMYFEPIIQPWDFAAGSLIVEEAGGRVTRWDGSAPDVTQPGSCLACGSGIGIERL